MSTNSTNGDARSPFKILNNMVSSPCKPAVPVPQPRSEKPKILPDGSQQFGDLVRLQVLNREVWYNVQEHSVLKWRENDSPFYYPTAARGQAGGECSACSHESNGLEQSGEARAAGPSYSTGEDLEVINCIELHVNDKCNFRCDYCYLKSAGIEYLDNEMPREVAVGAVDFMLEQLPHDKTGIIRLFGGEPFLSYDLMKFVVDYAEQKAGESMKIASMTFWTCASVSRWSIS